MEVFKDLFSDLTGILSLGVILFTVLILFYFIYMFVGRSASEE